MYSTLNVKIARSTQRVDLMQECEGKDHMQRKAQRAPVSKYAHTLCMFRLKCFIVVSLAHNSLQLDIVNSVTACQASQCIDIEKEQ